MKVYIGTISNDDQSIINGIDIKYYITVVVTNLEQYDP